MHGTNVKNKYYLFYESVSTVRYFSVEKVWFALTIFYKVTFRIY